MACERVGRAGCSGFSIELHVTVEMVGAPVMSPGPAAAFARGKAGSRVALALLMDEHRQKVAAA
ncbi:hypothetical protein IVB22_15345 [Bradyrhizobium sp. 190]|uniref:hypothetical protein n=1 Tax=Bradyrhizobium sp. 190 TaxID=2782658 RepID=UPI001FF9CC1D|nr:hypothetical protein [Bradyrhizobium sp. 190]MCK1513914.1 hypothetical protein [Bradyrhizobium sp. 190]